MGREKKADLISVLKKEMTSLNGAPKYASFDYTAKASGARLTDETARHLVQLNMSILQLYHQDHDMLTAIVPHLKGLTREAGQKLLDSTSRTLEKGIAADHDTYEYVEGLRGVKIHRETGEVYVMAVAVQKKVIGDPSTWRPVKHSALTIEQDKIKALLPSNGIRQYKNINIKTLKFHTEAIEL